MNLEEIHAYCLNKPGVTEEFPFDKDTLVFKVMGKMFALIPLEATQLQMNLKCDPDEAQELRARYTGVLPGYHMSKVHWNTVVMDGSFTAQELLQWIDNSYNLIVASLPKKIREQLPEK